MNCVRAARSGTSLSTRLYIHVYIHRYAASIDSCWRPARGTRETPPRVVASFFARNARKEEEVVVDRLRLDAVCVCSHNRYAVMIASDGCPRNSTLSANKVQSGVGAVVE